MWSHFEKFDFTLKLRFQKEWVAHHEERDALLQGDQDNDEDNSR